MRNEGLPWKDSRIVKKKFVTAAAFGLDNGLRSEVSP